MEKIPDAKTYLDTTETELVQFITPGGERLRVLVVESVECLAELRRRLPRAEICVVTADEFIPEEERFAGLELKWTLKDYTSERLPFDEEYFDCIIAARALETVKNPQDIASGLSGFLKQTGFLLTSFLNVRCWKVLAGLRDGHFRYSGRHMFALPELEKLFYATRFKEVLTTGLKLPAPVDFLQGLEGLGFENDRDDLETEIWLVRAARSMPEIAALKSCFTPAVRAQLSKLLRRLEYGIDEAENLAALRELCRREGIFPAYIANFLQIATWYREALVRVLVRDYLRRGEAGAAEELLAVLAEDELEQQDDVLAQRIRAEWEGGLLPGE